MKMKECPKFLTCSAPICPLSKNSKNNCSWFPDEEICKRPVIRKKYKFTSKQFKIRLKNNNYLVGSFDVEMLLRVKRITDKIKGLKDIKKLKLYNTWLKEHPINNVDSEVNKKRIAEATERIMKYRLRRLETGSSIG